MESSSSSSNGGQYHCTTAHSLVHARWHQGCTRHGRMQSMASNAWHVI
jgi:hypothetical protein